MKDLVSPELKKYRQTAAVPFTKPYMTGNELPYITQALDNNHLCGNGRFTELCHEWFNKNGWLGWHIPLSLGHFSTGDGGHTC